MNERQGEESRCLIMFVAATRPSILRGFGFVFSGREKGANACSVPRIESIAVVGSTRRNPQTPLCWHQRERPQSLTESPRHGEGMRPYMLAFLGVAVRLCTRSPN